MARVNADVDDDGTLLIEVVEEVSGEGIPRVDWVCGNCDHSLLHRQGELTELRCHFNPPVPVPIGLQEPKLAGQYPRPVVIPVWPPCTLPCSKWRAREPDHPDNRGASKLPAQNAPSAEKVQ
jgi:hypothetical protein